ncbi:XRE family transcriptional regulator [Streptomyces flavofungini]|uniref:XRE family transcriptional regulator n=1 Tax=Streptomyces flavofungini TaxID=68200 RepID=UPI0025AF21A6|nr:XRE family transcriptional regulator [Streptomyces flavofungini]WJV47525.1 XRE family transcriptional regulator [Streptomyces flavofungini]
MTTSTITLSVEAPPTPVRALCTADTPLAHARAARGWSQCKVVRALTLLAEHWGWDIACESSLKTQLSMWENDARRPGPKYQVLLCALYHSTPDELGFTRKGRPPTRAALADRVATLEALLERLVAQSGAVVV